MGRAVPVAELRSLADWRAELGLDRLRAELISGEMVAWYYDGLIGKWEETPRDHWRGQVGGRCPVEMAVGGWGWHVGGDVFSPGIPLRVCPIRAARPAETEATRRRRAATGAEEAPAPPATEQDLKDFVAAYIKNARADGRTPTKSGLWTAAKNGLAGVPRERLREEFGRQAETLPRGRPRK